MKKQKTTIYRRMKISEIQNVNDFNQLNLEEMNDLYRNLYSKVNKRIERLKKDPIGKLSPALAQYKKKFEVRIPKTKKGKQNYRNKLYHEVTRMRNFIGSSTSTIKGVREFKSDIEKTITRVSESKTKVKFNPSQFKRFWRIWDKVRELLPEVRDTKNGSPVWKLLAEMVKRTGGGRYIKNDDIIFNLVDFYNTELRNNELLNNTQEDDALLISENLESSEEVEERTNDILSKLK